MTDRSTAKRVVASALASDVVASFAQPLTRGLASIFMMHRFADADRGNAGHDPAALRKHLEYLRRKRFELVSLTELRTRLESGDTRAAKSVAFTIDDGYADYATVAAPIFAAFDCPATVFIVTGVVDDRGWYWWDRVRVAFERAEQPSLTIDIAGSPARLTWTRATAVTAARTLVERLKVVADGERRTVVAMLPQLINADIPASPPAEYASMTWEEIRGCGATTTFGPHTVTHPILARTDDATARFEMTESWRRLSAETSAAIPVFCYPNGESDDAGQREFAIAREAGIAMAVTTRPGYASSREWRTHPNERYRLPRFPYPDDTLEFIQFVNGVERVKLVIRSSLRAWRAR